MRPCFQVLICFFAICGALYAGGRDETGSRSEKDRVCAPCGADEIDTVDQRHVERESMVRTQLFERGISDEDVLEAMAAVPRHLFVPETEKSRAYADRPLPIGYGQTISQPYIVALMTWLLEIEPGDRILEIGTGSGYQAAVLAELTDQVFSIEIIEPLAERAEETLREAGYHGVKVRRGDGYYGWAEAAPFHGIIVTAAAGHVPPPLVEQLALGGRIIVPLGNPYQVQILTIVHKDPLGQVSTEQLLPVRFVPMTGRVEGREP